MNMDIFRLRLAFGRLDWKHVAFEAGQDWSVFAPLNPTSLAAYAIPEFSESGNPWIRLPQIRAELTSGAKDATQRATLLWKQALQEYAEPAMDPAVTMTAIAIPSVRYPSATAPFLSVLTVFHSKASVRGIYRMNMAEAG